MHYSILGISIQSLMIDRRGFHSLSLNPMKVIIGWMRLSFYFTLLLGIFIGCNNAPDRESAAGEDSHPSDVHDDPTPYASIAKTFESEERVIWQKPELIIDKMGDLDGRTVADIGAGTGYFAFRLADRGADVIAIDIDPRAIRWMENEESNYPEEIRDRFKTRLAQEGDPKLKQGEADIVLLVNTYIYINDRVNYFTRLKTGILPGGRVYIIDFKKKQTAIGPNIEDRLSHETIERELSESGYAIVEVDTLSLEYQYIIEATPSYHF